MYVNYHEKGTCTNDHSLFEDELYGNEIILLQFEMQKMILRLTLVYKYMLNTCYIFFIEISICCTFYIVLFWLTGNPPDPGLCGCAEQQRVAEPCSSGHGARSDGDPGNVGQGLVPQTASPLLTGHHQALSGKGGPL